MNNNEKLKLFWNITKHINKKCCENKLVIKDITLFRHGDLHKSFPKSHGWYFADKKSIKIYEDEPLIMQVIILIHEITHAYQRQILKNKGRHDRSGGRIYRAFLNETDKIVKIKV